MFKPLFPLALAAAGLLAHPTYAAEFTPIATAEDFEAAVVGKTLYLGDTSAIAHADGTMTVVFKGKEIAGTWEWQDGYFCRVLQSYSTKADCQLWEYDGTDFRVTRDKGTGKEFIYSLE